MMWHTPRILLDPDATAGGGGGGSGGSAAGGGTSAPAQGAPNSPAASTAGTFQPPANHRVVSDTDYASRDAAFSALTGAGFKDHAEFSAYAPLLKAMREAGHDPATLAKVFGRKETSATTEKAGEPKDVATAVREALVAERRETAEREHGEWTKDGPTKATEQILKSVLGETPDETLKSFVPELVASRIFAARVKNAYPDGHSLAGMPGRINDADIQGIVGDLKKIVDGLSARDLKTIGAAANRQAVPGQAPATAGNAGGNGKSGDDGPRQRVSREELLNDVREELQRQTQMAGATAG